MLIAYNYIMNNNGIVSSLKYPYKGTDTNSCSYNSAFSVTSLSSFELLPAGDEILILRALVAIGPLSCAIDASQTSFQYYTSGVYNEPLCTTEMTHAMLIVGKEFRKKDFIKN
jgi:hypothetical protein